MERFRRRGKVRILVAEQLVGDFTGQQHPDVGPFVDGLAAEVHAQAGPDGGDVVGAQQCNDRFQGVQHFLPGHGNFHVIAADVVGHLTGVFQVDGVGVHADGEGPQGFVGELCGDGTDQAGIQAAGQETAQGGVGVHALFHGGNQFPVNLSADGFQIVGAVPVHAGDVAVPDEMAVGVVVTGREGEDFPADAHQVFGFAGEDQRTVVQRAVVEGPDADGVPGGDEGVGFVIVQHQGKFGVQHGEHIETEFPVHGQQNFTVGIAAEGVLVGEGRFHPAESVQLAVAHHVVAVQLKGLHPLVGKPHDGQPVEAQIPAAGVDHAGAVGTAGNGLGKLLADGFPRDGLGTKTHNCTHLEIPPKK